MDFEKLPKSGESTPTQISPEVTELPRSNTNDARNATGSLLRDNAPAGITLPKTPAAMQAQEDYFTPAQSGATTNFLRPNDPKSLVRSDVHIPEWGAGGLYFNQPRARARRLADNILEYQKNEERVKSQREQSRERARSLHPTNSGGKKTDPRWEQEDSELSRSRP